MEKFKFTVNREKWYRGRGRERSCLLRDDGKMCCLGFFALACGLEKSTILNRGSPEDFVTPYIISQYPNFARLFNSYEYEDEDLHVMKTSHANSNSTDEMMKINDSYLTYDDYKESKLKEEFAKIDVEVEFVG